jgi:adenylate kinase
MIVIAHQHPIMHTPASHLAGLPQRVEEEPPVVVMQEEDLPTITTGNDMAKGGGVL